MPKKPKRSLPKKGAQPTIEETLQLIADLLESGKTGKALREMQEFCGKVNGLEAFIPIISWKRSKTQGKKAEDSGASYTVAQNDSQFAGEIVSMIKAIIAGDMYAAKHYVDALKLIQEASPLLPSTSGFLFSRAMIFWSNTKYSEALTDLLRVRDQMSRPKELTEDPEFFYKSGFKLSDSRLPEVETLIGEASLILGNTKEARLQFLRAMDRYEVLDPDLLVRIARGLLEVAEYGDVLRIHKYLMLNFPNRPEGELVSGLLKFQLNDQGAVEDFESAILKDPTNDELLRMKIGVLMYLNEFEAAMRMVNQWVSIRPNEYHPYLIRGLVHTYQDNYLGAVEAFTRARDLSPTTAVCHLWLAVGLSERGLKSEAEASLAIGLAIDNVSEQAEYTQGRVALNSKHPEEGMTHLTNAARLNPENGEFHYYLSLGYKHLGNYPAAEASLSKASELGFRKATILLGKIKDAKHDWHDEDLNQRNEHRPREEVQRRQAELHDLVSMEVDQARSGARAYLQDDCVKECEKRQLLKGVTINRETKYEIALAIGVRDIGMFDKFRSGQSAYQLISKMLSVSGYKKKRRVE